MGQQFVSAGIPVESERKTVGIPDGTADPLPVSRMRHGAGIPDKTPTSIPARNPGFSELSTGEPDFVVHDDQV